MTDITRVPLPPVAKGALTKLWIGVVLAVALGGAVAYETHQKGMKLITERAGSGPMPVKGDFLQVNYVGTLANGKVFDQGERVGFPVGGVIPGLSDAFTHMQKGGKYHVFIPARLGYADHESRNEQTGEVTIPANSDLEFEIEVVDYRSRADAMREQMMMEALKRQMQARGAVPGAGGPAGAAPGGAPDPGIQ